MRVKWWDWIETTWAKAKASFDAAAVALKAKVSTMAKDFVGSLDWAKATAAEVGNWVKERLKDTVAVIAKAIEAVKDRLVLYFKNNKFDALKGFATCIMTSVVSDDKLTKSYNPAKVFTDFWATIAGLTTVIGWAKLLVNLICNWQNIKDGIEAIQKSIEEKDKAKKWEFAGVAAAKFIISIAG